jgi:thiol:disulfide interchange protein DsbC
VNGAVTAALRFLLVAALLPWAGAARADEAAIRAALEPRLGKIDRVAKSPVAGIWEVLTGPQVQYTDATGQYLISGPLQDTKTGRNLTAERQFALLPLDLALKQTRGSSASAARRSCT